MFSYIVDHICSSLDRADLHKVKDTIRLIASVVNSTTPFNKSEAKALDKKLEKCYNRENDPRSAHLNKLDEANGY
ncbi:unnamed protein product [Didymodactylos carnosus]|uniref:Uncharacterized protein n=1 Tax=Didymodactylos carnosus TaxID=1234261 RepID=A0A8S2SRU1_9BILA|nr:unnamed protein product [Didymodactylos carnosus]CAF4238197.1 unnamed protein product [Didymodactylos carnosus]